MATELPIACSLTAAQLPERIAEMRELGRHSLRALTTGANRAELRFATQARERLGELVAAERECCGFMSFELEESRGEVVLRIEAPEGAEPVLEGLVAAFSRAR